MCSLQVHRRILSNYSDSQSLEALRKLLTCSSTVTQLIVLTQLKEIYFYYKDY